MRVPCRALLAAAGALLLSPAATAQLPQGVRAFTGVRPDEVTVGDRFTSVVRIAAPPGAGVQFPAGLDSAADVQALGKAGLRADAARGEHTAAYRLVAWRPGVTQGPVLTARVTLPDGRTVTVPVRLALPTVRSVLPADTAGLMPRGAKDILPLQRRDWLPALLAALALIGLALLVARRLRRRRRAPSAPVLTPADARARALAELDRARAGGWLEREEWKPFYERTSAALREYLAALSPEWGTELTTSEVLDALVSQDANDRLARLLTEADLVKFARGRPTAARAERHWSEARAWVESFAAPEAEVEEALPAEVGG